MISDLGFDPNAEPNRGDATLLIVVLVLFAFEALFLHEHRGDLGQDVVFPANTVSASAPFTVS